MASPMLEAINVEKRFDGDVQALRGVDLAVDAGETVALIGESGCGKTTLLRLFNRLDIASSGEIRRDGRPIGEFDPIPLRRSTGYVPQDGGLLPHWNVARNVALVPELLDWDEARCHARTHELLELVGLAPGRFADRYPSELSGGQRQRVSFARALAADPDVILLDEPFGALDALTRLALHDEFLRIVSGLEKTLLLVTHDLAEAFRLADRVAVMKDGRILQTGTPRELLASPAEGYVAELIAMVKDESVA